MKLEELKERYNYAHKVFLKYRDTNNTNIVEIKESDFMTNQLKSIFKGSTIIKNNDNFLNYLGVDYIVIYNNKIITIDSKVCNAYKDNKIMIDAYRKDEDGEWEIATNQKINDLYLFKNQNRVFLIPTNQIIIPPRKDCFFLKRDLYNTTMKAVIDVSSVPNKIIRDIGEKNNEYCR